MKKFQKSADIPDNIEELNSPIASPMVKFNGEEGKNFTIFCHSIDNTKQ